MDSMKSNSGWELVDPPEGIKSIGCKWLYKSKRNIKGKVETFKARLVAKGYTQKVRRRLRQKFFTCCIAKVYSYSSLQCCGSQLRDLENGCLENGCQDDTLEGLS